MWLTLGLATLGAVLTLAAASQPWVSAVVTMGELRIPLQAAGSALTSVIIPLGIGGLAGALAVITFRGPGRVVTGALMVCAALTVIAATVRVLGDVADAAAPAAGKTIGLTEIRVSEISITLWPWLTLLGGVLIAVAGVLTIVRGRRWPVISGRYQAPREQEKLPPAKEPPHQLWDTLDRGNDPTI